MSTFNLLLAIKMMYFGYILTNRCDLYVHLYLNIYASLYRNVHKLFMQIISIHVRLMKVDRRNERRFTLMRDHLSKYTLPY